LAITKSTKRFLCIDDDRTLLLIVKQILTKSFGAQTLEVFQASTGEEVLQIMREIKPDIILCDIHMPGMDGFEVCQRVRELKLRSAVILMSAYDAEQDNAIKASDTGADAYLSKPIKKGELLFVVNFVMRVAHLNDTVFEKNKQLEASLVQLKQFSYQVKIEGHTDNIDIRTKQYPSNWELSAARAAEVARKLVRAGFDPAKLSIEAFAQYRPKVPNDSRQGRATNRRIEIVYQRGSIRKHMVNILRR
jgi:DNA-binding response OmpR family regulator